MITRRAICLLTATTLVLICTSTSAANSTTRPGYYRSPTTDGRTIVFTAEGDLWRVPIAGGAAQRLTSHPGIEFYAALSKDGERVAFSATYEGPMEVYVMPLRGGKPRRLTYHGGAMVVGFTPRGEVLYRTRHYSTLPNFQLVAVDPVSSEARPIPLHQASDGAYDDKGTTLFFTRLPFQGSRTKRYKGGTAQKIWKHTRGAPEAIPLTADYAGTSKGPSFFKGRVYFASDRDGSMNLWSMKPDGKELEQHTRHRHFDLQAPYLGAGKLVYQVGADLWLYEIATDKETKLAIELSSDFDQMRERWVHDPLTYLTSAHLSPDGSRVALTARGEIFTAPVKSGRLAAVSRNPAVRYRDARYIADAEQLLALADATGELEFWRLPENGVGEPEQLTKDGKRFRFYGVPSPDGKRIAYVDKDLKLWAFDIDKKKTTELAVCSEETPPSYLAWSPDSRYLAYAMVAPNTYAQIWLHDFTTGRATAITSDRVNSYSPVFSPEGEHLYFLSERHLVSAVRSPWGARQPEPFLDKPTLLYVIPLQREGRSPFVPADELNPEEEEDEDEEDEEEKDDKKKKDAPPPEVKIDFAGIGARVMPVPIPPGNYDDLTVTEEQLYWLAWDPAMEPKLRLLAAPIADKDVEITEIATEVESYELSANGEKVLVRQKEALYVLEANGEAPEELPKTAVDLSGWRFSFDPKTEWRQIFTEAWRLERDYFYDRDMHGVDWRAVLKTYLPLVDRVTSRGELSDLIGQMVGELAALHIFVFGGDHRSGDDAIDTASLGATWRRDRKAGGYVVEKIYRADPDYPEERPPFDEPTVQVRVGDVIERVNGVLTLSVPNAASLLRDTAGKQVRLSVRPKGTNRSRDVIVKPLDPDAAYSLRYSDWELSRRARVEERGNSKVGYVHLRAMGGGDYTSWARDFYPVFKRQGLIIDVRNNRGGNIDSWILEKLMRKAWFYWAPPVGISSWNMQYAFRGHMVVICNAFTASDGEAFAEGFRRLGLGKVLGTRTWGGEIWLSFDNWLVDKGIASAAEYGVYGPEGVWLIEGHGVEPDIVVDNLPRATFDGGDAQLDAAVEHLLELIKKDPRPVPPIPKHPDKSLKKR